MLVRLGKLASPKTTSSPSVPGLPWMVALAAAVAIPPLLPIKASLVTLAGFAALIGTLAVLGTAWLIALLPILAVLGSYFLPLEVAGVNFYGFRLLLMLLAVFCTPLTVASGWWFNPVAQRSFFFIMIWLMYGLLSLFWTIDPISGIREIVMIVFGTALVMTLLAFKIYKYHNLDKLIFGWLVSFVFISVFALIEIQTGRHLESFFFHPIYKPRNYTFVQATLGGPNAFGGYLLLVVPFMLMSLERTRRVSIKMVYLAMVAGLAVLVVYSGSRLALIGLAIQLVFYVAVLQRRWLIPFAVVATVGMFVVSYGELLGRSSNLFLATKFEKVEERSIGYRIALTVNGVWMAVRTAGIGVGAGAFEKEIEQGDKVMAISGQQKWEPHNFWVRVLSQYGLVGFGGLVVLLGWFGRLGWRARRWRGGDPEVGVVGRAIVSGLIGYLFFGVTTGSVFLSHVNWMFLGSLMVMAAFVHEAGRRGGVAPRG